MKRIGSIPGAIPRWIRAQARQRALEPPLKQRHAAAFHKGQPRDSRGLHHRQHALAHAGAAHGLRRRQAAREALVEALVDLVAIVALSLIHI